MQSKAREAAVLAEVGEGGFGAQDLELTQQLGALSWVRVCALYLYEPTMYSLKAKADCLLPHRQRMEYFSCP